MKSYDIQGKLLAFVQETEKAHQEGTLDYDGRYVLLILKIVLVANYYSQADYLWSTISEWKFPSLQYLAGDVIRLITLDKAETEETEE